MKKVIISDFIEYNSCEFKLGNYHYCNCFLKDNYEALWLSNPYNQLIYFRNKEDYYFRKSISKGERHYLAENVYGFSPYALRLYGNHPFSRNPKIIEQFEKFIRPDVKKTLKQMDFNDVDVLWISNPKAYWLTNVVKYKKFIYRIADDYSHFPEYPNIKEIDEMLIRKADGVVIASSTLKDHVAKYDKDPLILSNGVEFDHFNKTGLAVPAEYSKNQRKKIIYVGAIKYWFDIELVKKIALQVNADVFLIGKCETNLEVLENLENLHVLGPKKYDDLPAYLQYADIAIIPFIKSPMTDSVSPIKLYEYCSAGVAVVTMNLEETVKLNAPVSIACNHEEFIAAVQHYLKEGYDRNVLREYGRENSWQKRYEKMKRLFMLDNWR
ncbi:glycosyltransferase [Dehalobacter sp. TBBPA1]|uniref:glycosyltransferase n=1 Tax=Dehalobacter sp. TBBPA1 TaxID=3235037 RepID=UPI0034A2C37A